LASEADRVAAQAVSGKGVRPPFPTHAMVRILVPKRLHNLSDEQVEFQSLYRLSLQRVCGLTLAANNPDRTMVWNFVYRVGAIGARALFDSLNAQLLSHGYLARGGRIFTQRWFRCQGSTPAAISGHRLMRGLCSGRLVACQAPTKDAGTMWTKGHHKGYFGYDLSVDPGWR